MLLLIIMIMESSKRNYEPIRQDSVVCALLSGISRIACVKALEFPSGFFLIIFLKQKQKKPFVSPSNENSEPKNIRSVLMLHVF